jgi:hypothetical protein
MLALLEKEAMHGEASLVTALAKSSRVVERASKSSRRRAA